MLASGVYQDIFADVPQAFSGLSASNHNKTNVDSKKGVIKMAKLLKLKQFYLVLIIF